MATRGEFIFIGYIPGTGTVRVFQDLDNTSYVFALPTRSDQFRYVHRSMIQPRRNHTLKTVKEPVAAKPQPTLF